MTDRFLLWDQDGVLVDSEKWFFLATRKRLADLGVSLDRETYLRFQSEGRLYWDLARDVGVPDETIEEARIQRDRDYQRSLATEDIAVEGIRDVLDQLRDRYRMAIVSTCRRTDFDIIHRSGDLLKYFEFALTIEDYPRRKPHPDPYAQALSRFQANPSEAVAIEDAPRGLRAALAAGLRCIIIRNDLMAQQDFPGAYRVLDSVREVPGALPHRSNP